MHQEKIIKKLHELGINELRNVTTLNTLSGDYINLNCELPNGEMAKILNDDKKYLSCQIEKTGSDRCYGVAADDRQIAVYEYGCNGTDAVLIIWVKI